MTKPTDRQIEAVEDVLRGLVIISGDSTWDLNYVARKVLTAAAEAGADRAQEFYEAWVKTRDALEKLSAEHKATIERCAKVVNEFYYIYTRDELIAAIRALKDKP